MGITYPLIGIRVSDNGIEYCKNCGFAVFTCQGKCGMRQDAPAPLEDDWTEPIILTAQELKALGVWDSSPLP